MSTVAAGGGSVLDTIVARTRERVGAAQESVSLEELRARSMGRGPARSFSAALTRANGVRVIAEHKRRSPSHGAILEGLEPATVGRAFACAGAAAISVLTEPDWFGGSLDHLIQIRAAVDVPLLCKDFFVDAWQVWEARAAGADAILLIAAALDDRTLAGLLAETAAAGLEALVEVHERGELDRALAAGAHIVGVNNRNLRTLDVSLDVSLVLVRAVPDDVVAVSESGLRTGDDLARLAAAGFDAFLIGESLMATGDPGGALGKLLADATGRLGARS